MGWHNLHAPPVHVNAEIRSPALAALAREGGMFSPATAAGYNEHLTMMPATLRAAGYRTHLIGKWHCGYWQRRFLPTSRGFDTFTGYLSGSEDHYTQRTSDSCGGAEVTATDLWHDGGDGTGGANAAGMNGSYSGYLY
eukprot:gene20934-40390_t